MSKLAVANIIFETTEANRIEYTGNNVVRVRANGGLQIPFGTTAQRVSPEYGIIRYNTDLQTVEMYDAGGWYNMPTGGYVNSIYTVANSAYAAANNVGPQIAPTFNTANAAFSQANLGYTSSNVVYAAVNSAFGSINSNWTVTNTVYGVANAAYGAANNVGPQIAPAFNQANLAYTSSNSANSYANSTYVKLTAPNQTITGDLAITGNLTLLGNATTITSNNLIVNDSLIYLAANNDQSDVLDIGFVGHYSNGTANLHTGLFRDHAGKQYYLFSNLGGPEPETINDLVPYANGMINAVLNADLTTSNLTLGGANTINWITSGYGVANAAFGKANNALANTSGVSFNGSLYIPGNLGVGTTSPTYPLVVSKNGYQGFEVSVDGTADAPVLISYNRANGAYSRISMAAANIYFLTGSASASERMVISSSGSVGINQTTPQGIFHVTAQSINAAAPTLGWPVYNAESDNNSRQIWFDTAGNSANAVSGFGATVSLVFGSYYDSRVVLTPSSAGGSAPSDQGTGSGRDMMIKGGTSDNSNGRIGGRLFLSGGSGYATSPGFNTNYGSVIMQPLGGNVGIGTTSTSYKFHQYGGDYMLESGTSGTGGKIYFKTTDNADLNKWIGQESYWTVIGSHANEGFRTKNSSGTYYFSAASSGTVTATADFRAPIFYDTNNTAYYVDPNSTSYINSLYIEGGVASYSNADASYSRAAIEVREYAFAGSQTDTWANAPRIGFHWGGRVASQIAMNSSGRITILNNPGNDYEAFACGSIFFNSGFGSTVQAYGCRAWVNTRQSGGISVRGSGGVSSTTDSGSLTVTVNFSTTMPDTGFSTTAYARDDNDDGIGSWVGGINSEAVATTYKRVRTTYSSGEVSLAFHR